MTIYNTNCTFLLLFDCLVVVVVFYLFVGITKERVDLGGLGSKGDQIALCEVPK